MSVCEEGEGEMAQILIVDNDDPTRGCLAQLLRFKGYTVDEVADGGQAMERLTISPSDLVLVSVNMPDMEGWDACRQLRARSRVPILMISSLAPPFSWEGAQDGGINAFIPKSADLRGVLSWVHGTGRRGCGGVSGPLARV